MAPGCSGSWRGITGRSFVISQPMRKQRPTTTCMLALSSPFQSRAHPSNGTHPCRMGHPTWVNPIKRISHRHTHRGTLSRRSLIWNPSSWFPIVSRWQLKLAIMGGHNSAMRYNYMGPQLCVLPVVDQTVILQAGMQTSFYFYNWCFQILFRKPLR